MPETRLPMPSNLFGKRKPLWSALSIAVLGIVFAAFRSGRPPDPRIEGTRLSAWIEIAENTAPSNRRDAARTTLRENADAVEPVLFAWLQLCNPRTGLGLRKALEEIGIVKRHDPNVRCCDLAARGFGALGDAAAPSVPKLIELLHDDGIDHSVRRALRDIGPIAVPALAAALETGDDEIRNDIAWAFCEGAPAPPELIPTLMGNAADPGRSARFRSMEALAQLEEIPPEVIPVFIDGLQAEKSGVRDAAVRGLSRCGRAAATAIPALESYLDAEGKDDSNRVKAAIENIRTDAGRSTRLR